MSYIKDKEEMKRDSDAHRRLVWLTIKVTFCVIAVLLFAFCVTMVISLIRGNGNDGDTEAPTIIGPGGNVYVGYVGESPIYKKMIRVEDNVDKSPKVTVDNSQVNINAEGSYKVYYTVTDEAGNISRYTLTYLVKRAEYSEKQLMEFIAEKADKLGMTKDMSKTELVRKIYSYVNSQETIYFTDESNIPDINRDSWESDWTEEAVRTLESEEGDCYSYYALSKAFFEYFGIENIGIRRAENYEGAEDDGTHFWSVVKVESGWYYYDATRLAGTFSDGGRDSCLITEAKLKSYRGSHGEDYFYKMIKPVGFPQISTKEIG